MDITIPLPEFAPDQSIHSNVLLTCDGVYPAKDGYRPVQDVTPLSDALAADFQGGISAISADGSSYLLAGTAAGLYRLQSDETWSTLVTALSISGRWRFAQFGNYVVAVNGSDTREVDLAAGTASIIAAAPSATSICVVGDHVVLGQPGGAINSVKWSAFADHTGWIDATNQAGSQPMQTGGAVMGLAGGEYGIILQRERIVRMQRTGDDEAPFEFAEISANYGCANGSTIAQAGRTVFFYSDRGFMALDDGAALRRIGSEKVDRAFAALVNRDDLIRIYTAIDPQNAIVIWGVPGNPGKLWIYNWELDRWATASIGFSGLFPGFTTSIGLDDLPSLGYTNIDTMAISLDDPRWSGGNPRLYVVDENREVGVLNGDTLTATLELGYYELTKGRRARIRKIRPVSDAIEGFAVRVNCKARMGDLDDIETSGTLNPSGVIPIRNSGRYSKISLEIAGGTDWTLIQSLEVECEAGGRR